MSRRGKRDPSVNRSTFYRAAFFFYADADADAAQRSSGVLTIT